ncbi:phosphatase PAP2 family protein [Arthrobacter sp. PAMC25564]|uniref:phosphatase PAP2 family protein n=1 Tax=Arthrobacter sp. PAMC25564 TaxID=2565366 RepID=UPI0010A26DBA|nr:phosphatase PAP2 family protein [Arthrobacter sp. PAMC25564]QCB95620.1 phosphatase PAP2 family protein [Arthrobacter sp. PAMC25564]
MPAVRRVPRAPSAPARRARTGSQRSLFFGAAGLLVAGDAFFWFILAAVQSDSGPAALDSPVHDGLVGSRNPLATGVLTAVATVTSPLWMALIGLAIALAWAAWNREIWRPGLLMGAMAASFGLSTLIGHGVDRARPSAGDFMLGPADSLSFPSGHTFGAGVFLLVLAYLFVAGRAKPTTAVLAFAGAAAGTAVVALARLYLGYQWLTDVLASLGLAVAVTGTVILVDGLRTARSAGNAGAPRVGAGPAEAP